MSLDIFLFWTNAQCDHPSFILCAPAKTPGVNQDKKEANYVGTVRSSAGSSGGDDTRPKRDRFPRVPRSERCRDSNESTTCHERLSGHLVTVIHTHSCLWGTDNKLKESNGTISLGPLKEVKRSHGWIPSSEANRTKPVPASTPLAKLPSFLSQLPPAPK